VKITTALANGRGYNKNSQNKDQHLLNKTNIQTRNKVIEPSKLVRALFFMQIKKLPKELIKRVVRTGKTNLLTVTL